MANDYNEFRNSELIQNLMKMHNSANNADARLYFILERQNQITRKVYYKVIKALYPLKRLFSKL